MRTNRSSLFKYGFAFGSVVVAWMIRRLLDPWVGDQVPFATFFIALLFTAKYSGARASVVTLVLGGLAGTYFFLPPRNSFELGGSSVSMVLGFYLIVGVTFIFFHSALESARGQAEAKALEASHSQEALTASERHFRTLTDHAPVGIFLTDTKGNCLFVNRRWCEMAGMSLEEAEGQGWANALHPEDRDRVFDEWYAAVTAGREFNSDYRFRTPEGKVTWIRGSAIALHDDRGAPAGFVGTLMDTTEQTKARCDLEESEQRFRQLAENIRKVFWMSDPGKNEVLYVSPAYEEIWGRTCQSLYEQPRSFLEAIHPQDRDRVAAGSLDKQSKGEATEVEYRVVRPDGSVRWIRDRSFPVRNEWGVLYRVVGFAEDVTEKKHADLALQESEARFRAAVDQTAVGVALVGPDRIPLFVNQGLCEMLGYSDVELMGTTFADVTHSDDLAQDDAQTARLMSGEISSCRYEKRYIRKNGSLVWGDVSLSAVRDDNDDIRYVAGVVVDVTERKHAEATLRFLADASATLAGLVDCESTLQKIARLAVPTFADWCTVDMLDENRSLQRLAVSHVDAGKVDLAHELHRRYPPNENAARGVWKVVETGESDMVHEISEELVLASTQDPELLRVVRDLGLRSYMGIPLGVRGRVIGVMSFFTAESGRRYTDADLAIAEDLGRRASIAIENSRLFQEVRQADRRKDEFLAVLAHELRNPLAPVRNALEILKQVAPKEGPGGRAREIAERQVHSLTRLVDDLLDAGRIVQGKLELRRERLDLATIVARAVETVKPLIETEAHDLSVVLPQEPVWIDADLVRITQVFSNLLSNAARYTERGGRIEVRAVVQDDRALVHVTDDGIGIPPEMLPRIFDMFMQVASTESRQKIGLGIGLTLAKNIVDLHHGEIEARSDGPGKGSTFIVRLPLAPSGRQNVPSRGDFASTSLSAPRRKVLVVDDNIDAAESLSMLLQMQGHDVFVAYDGMRALGHAVMDPPEMAFFDIGMPTMDGYELARRFRKDPKLNGVFLVAVTGWGQEEVRRRTREVGFDRHLVKPVEPEALAKVLLSTS